MYKENIMSNIKIHNKSDFEGMREAGKITAMTLDFIEEYVTEGITTDKLNTLCHDFIISHNAIPAPLNYKGFPKSICTSINNVVCHGIPDNTILKSGDIVKIDITSILNGWHGDSCRTYFVGSHFNTNPKLRKASVLTKVTYDAMMLAINAVKPGVKLSEVGKIIQNHVHKYGFQPVRDFCGHGIGKSFHAEPSVLHYYEKGLFTDDIVLQEGMFFTIEPMINEGKWGINISKHDKWTVTTRDNKLSAQFEHTIGITEHGAEIFTLSLQDKHFPQCLKKLAL